MNALIRWNPLREERDLINTFFESALNPTIHGLSTLAIDMRETESAYQVEAALPGMQVEDIKIKVEDDVLTIIAESKRENEDAATYERIYRNYRRSIRLPESVDSDQAEARYENGILRLTLPKTPGKQAKHIPVRVRTSEHPIAVNHWFDPLKQGVEKLIAPLKKIG